MHAKNFVELERNAPLGMPKHIVERGLQGELVLLWVAHVAGLQEIALRLDVVVEGHVVVSGIDHFQFVHAGKAQGGIGTELELGTARDVVYRHCDGTGAVGLHGYLFAQCVDGIAELLVNEECRLAPCEHNEGGWISGDFLADLRCGHRRARCVAGVAEEAVEIAPRKTDEDCSASCVVAFTLYGIEYFVDFIMLHARLFFRHSCKQQCCLPTPAPMPCSTGESVPSSSGQCFLPWG